jgi:hypothetical protein
VDNNGKFRKKCGYATVSLCALRDNNLSLKAKGLYSVIESYIRIPDFVLWKNTLINCSTDGIRSFNTAWDELKKAGYLKQYRIRIEKGWKYEYELLDEPDTSTPATIDVNMAGEIIKQQAECVDAQPQPENDTSTIVTTTQTAIEKQKKPDTEAPEKERKPKSTTLEYSKVLKAVNERLDYDRYISRLLPREKELATNIRDIVIEILLSEDEKIIIGSKSKNGDEVRATFNRFNYEMLTELISSLSDYYDYSLDYVHNPKAFITTCIYNQVKTNAVNGFS